MEPRLPLPVGADRGAAQEEEGVAEGKRRWRRRKRPVSRRLLLLKTRGKSKLDEAALMETIQSGQKMYALDMKGTLAH